LPTVSSIYFHVTQGAQRCFLEEMPGQTLFLATYKNPDFKPWGTPEFSDTAVVIRVLDPSGGTVLSRVADVSGKVAFHSTAGGEYQLCFTTNSSRWVDGAPQKFVRGRLPAALLWRLRRCFAGRASPAAPSANYQCLPPHSPRMHSFNPPPPLSAWT
jgi:hypothetical protein